MTLAAHVPVWATLPPVLLLAGWLLWYWRRMGDPAVPESRRRIRRASVLVMVVTLPFFVQAMSFLDWQTQPHRWATTWLLVMFCLGLILLTALIDVVNTLRLSCRPTRGRGPGP